MEECNGCLALGHAENCLNRVDVYISETNQCPCMNCIVKTMCRTECTEFRDFLNKYGPKLFKGKFTFRFRRVNGGV